MPRPKRYFHCSQDINGDPELWQFTSEFGDRSLRTWMQILVYLERSENQWRTSGDWLATLSRTVRQSVANVSRQIRWLVANNWLTVREHSADGLPNVFASPNWSKYNKTQEHKRISSNPAQGSGQDPLLSFPNPSVPSVPSQEEEKKKKEKISVSVVPTKRRSAEPVEVKSGETWDRYAQAYKTRYGTDPVRNAPVSSMLCKLVDKLGADKAPGVAAFYVEHNNQFYVSKRHPVNLLLNDAEGLHTQWVTGIKATTGEARNAEKRDDAMAQIARVKSIMGEK